MTESCSCIFRKLCNLSVCYFIPKRFVNIAIGDFYNDVPMLRAAGISATVGDANDDIKELVDFVGGRCLDGAVADFIEYIENTVKEK